MNNNQFNPFNELRSIRIELLTQAEKLIEAKNSLLNQVNELKAIRKHLLEQVEELQTIKRYSM